MKSKVVDIDVLRWWDVGATTKVQVRLTYEREDGLRYTKDLEKFLNSDLKTVSNINQMFKELITDLES
jgi:hypothetical protein